MATGFDKHQPISPTAVADLLKRDRTMALRALADVRPLNGSKPPKYPLQEALIAIIEAQRPALDRQQEAARKDKEQADKLALENAVTRKEYAPVELIEETIGDLVTGIKSLLRRRKDVPDEVKSLVMEDIKRILEEKAEE